MTVYGYVFTDEDGNPRLPEISTQNPEENPYVVDRPYRLIYTGDNFAECVHAINAAIVADDEGLATWATDESAASSGGE